MPFIVNIHDTQGATLHTWQNPLGAVCDKSIQIRNEGLSNAKPLDPEKREGGSSERRNLEHCMEIPIGYQTANTAGENILSCENYSAVYSSWVIA
jgi:hypothetical protein